MPLFAVYAALFAFAAFLTWMGIRGFKIRVLT
jgi:hypothetical protein